MSRDELENISLKNRIRELSKLLSIHQKDITKICELEDEVYRLKGM